MTSAVPLSIYAAWIATGLVWAAAALAPKRGIRKEPASSRNGHVLTLAGAFALLFTPSLRAGPLAWRIVPLAVVSSVGGLLRTLAGIAFAIWARFYLGGNWSAVVAIKQDHMLIPTGPYAIVRHPIYTGLLVAMLGTAVAAGELGGLLSVAVAFAGWLAKARLEEHFLQAQFGGTYLEYQQQVRALIPFVL
jgi:protein-S-isoprenylcysteine O-methyltransferase Ste14